MRAAVMVKNHTVQPRGNPASAARLGPSCGAFTKDGLGDQERSSSVPGREKPFGVTCGSTWSLQAAAALSPSLGRCDTGTPRAQPRAASAPLSHSWEQLLPLGNLGAPDCAAPGARLLPPWKGKGFRETTGEGGWRRAELQFDLFALWQTRWWQQGCPRLDDAPKTHTATATNRAEFLSRVPLHPSHATDDSPNILWPHWSHGLLLTTN